jgi:hypothetical protein
MSLKELIPVEVFLLISVIIYSTWIIWLPEMIFRSTNKEKFAFIILVILGYVMIVDYLQLILHTLFLVASVIMFFYFKKIKQWEKLWEFWLVNFEKIFDLFLYICVGISCLCFIFFIKKYLDIS